MHEWPWKLLVGTIKIKGLPGNSTIVDLIVKRAGEVRECLNHKVDLFQMFSSSYRLYRRGKNRCRRCGVKK